MWKIAEKALMCVQLRGVMRPSISEVIKDIQDAISIEQASDAAREGNSDELTRNSSHSSLVIGSRDLDASVHYLSVDESTAQPTAR